MSKQRRRRVQKAATAKPRKAAAIPDQPADWQEAHSPTVPHMVAAGVRVDPATGRPERTEVAQARRRAVDAEFAMDLTPEQIEAMEGIRRGWSAVVGAVAVRGAVYGERIGGGWRGGDGGVDVDITTHYRAWATSLARDTLRATIAVVCEGHTLRGAASLFRAAGRDHKWVKRRMLAGVAAWAMSAPRRARAVHETLSDHADGPR